VNILRIRLIVVSILKRRLASVRFTEALFGINADFEAASDTPVVANPTTYTEYIVNVKVSYLYLKLEMIIMSSRKSF
jgi:hypothetical protein